MKQNASTFFLILILLIGLSLLLYPSFSDWWNSSRSSQAIATYSEEVANLDKEKYDALWNDAWRYNQALLDRPNTFLLEDAMKAEYDRLLNLSGTGIMGYIEIPSLKVALPLYHGTEEAVLQVAIGHLNWSSLPVGGESTHCVVSGHRGLPSAKLFTNLDKLQEGDMFYFRILDEILTYEVDQILIVEPKEVESLMIKRGADYCTLFTCTPYGINTHRLLVRGHRVENPEEEKLHHIVSEAIVVKPVVVAPIVALPMLLILFLWLMFPQRGRHRPDEW